MAVRRLSLVLDLDSGQFSTRITDATGKVKTLSSVANQASENVKKVDKSTKDASVSIDAMNKAVWRLQLTLASVTFVFGGFTAALVKTNAEAQRSIALLEGLSKKSEQAARRADAASDFSYLRDFARNAPYQLSALTDVFVKLKSAGIDPTAGAMKALVDGVASFGGDAEVLKRATIAIQQMAGKGTVSMEELRQQLGEAMPTALKIMAKAAGKSVPEFVNEVSKGQVMWKSVQDKFFTELEAQSKGASERLMNTLGGQTSRIKSNLQTLMLAIGGFKDDGSFTKGGFMDTLTQGAKDLNTWLTNQDTLNGAKELGKSLADLLVATKDFFSFISAHAKELSIFAAGFVIVQGASMARQALENLAKAMLAVKVAQESQIGAAMAAKAAQLSVAAGMFSAQEAAARKAQAVVAANEAEIASIQINIAALREEALAYQTNIALAAEQKAAALAAATQLRGQQAAGVGNFGALAGRTGKTKLAGAASDALQADAAMIANKKALTTATSELAAQEALLAEKTAAQAVAQTAASAAIARTTIAARAMAAAGTGLTFLVDMLGGPFVVGAMAAAAALTYLYNKIKENNKFWDETYTSVANAKQVLSDTAKYVMETKGAMDALNNSNDNTAKGMEILAGKAGTLARKYNEAAIAAKTLAVNQSLAAAADLSNKIGEGERRLNSPLQLFTTFKQRQAQRDELAQMKSLRDQVTRRGQDLMSKSLDSFITPEDKKRLKGEFDDEQANSKAAKKAKNHVTDAQRMEARIDQMSDGQASINDLIDTLDRGSKAAEDMRSRIKGLRDEGKTISADQEARAVAAARANANLEKAYDGIKTILDGMVSQETAATEAGDNLGDSYNKTTASAERFNRKLDAQLAQVLALDPALAKDAERMKKLNDIVEQSKNAYLFTQIAEAARNLGEEMSKLDDHALNPDLSAWDAWKDKIKEIGDQINAARDLPEDFKTKDGKTRQDLINDLEKSRATYSDRYVRQIESDSQRELDSINESLMTADQARQAAYERELKRIETLTDVSNMNEEERAKYAGRMAELKAQLNDAANRSFQRDTETSAQKMAREWGDFSGNMKKLTGDWMSDFEDKLVSGEFKFSDFAEYVLKSYLDTLLKAQMAKMSQGLTDGLGSFLGTIGSAVLGAFTGGATFSAAHIDASTGLMLAPGHHTGKGPGGPATFYRMVDPGLFNAAPRFHTGRNPAGVNQGEIAAIIREDEGVFTPEQMKALGRGGGKAPEVQVNVINESGMAMGAQQGGTKFDGNKYVVDVLVDALSKPGRARNAVLSAK